MNLFDLGQSRFHQGEYAKALEALEAFCALPGIDRERYIEAVVMRLRIYIESDNNDGREKLLAETHPILCDFGEHGLAVFNYLLAYHAHADCRYIESLSLFEKSLEYAVESRQLYPLFLSLFGSIFIKLVLNKDLDSLDAKITTLETIAQELQRPDFEISAFVLRSRKALIEKQHAKAVAYIWRAYDLVKSVKNNFLIVSIISMLGYTYIESDDQENARIYIDLAHRMVDPYNYKKLSRNIAALRNRLGVPSSTEFDLILDESKKILIEKSKGPIELKNQFILMDLMRLLMKNPGVAFSKEELVKKLWNAKYNPATHDNSIYVTIKRARSLIEPDPQQSKYILRSRQGYLLSQGLKLAIYQQEGLT